jgi:hypothetical protein
MFLHVLNNTEKEAFINLLLNTAKIDGNFSKKERHLIESYALEMDYEIDDIEDYTRKNSELINELKLSSEKNKKIMFVELVGLMYIDEIHKNEQTLLDDIQDEFGFLAEYKNAVLDWVAEIGPLYKKGFYLAGLLEE